MNALTKQNPFGVQQSAPQGGALSKTDQSRAIAEVQAAMMVARMNPRDPVAAMDRILNACARPTLAEAAVYQYSRGGSDISGPSIRLAEAIAQQWGNIQFGIRELEQRAGESEVLAYAWDLETNTRREMVFSVPHTRDTKGGRKEVRDSRDVYELVANMGARRMRACILAVIPGDVIEEAVAQCDLTMRAKADTSADGIKKLLDAFADYGVDKGQIEKRIQRRIEAIQPAQIVALKKIYASLRDGMSSADDWFESSDAPPEPKAKEPQAKNEPPAAPKATAEERPKNESGPQQMGAPTVITENLSDSQRRILFSRATSAGMDMKALHAKFGTINLENLNDVLAELKKIADAQEG